MAEPPFAEPAPIACLFVSGVACEFLPGYTRIMAWVSVPALPGEPHERRVIARLVMPDDVARELQRQLKNGLRVQRN